MPAEEPNQPPTTAESKLSDQELQDLVSNSSTSPEAKLQEAATQAEAALSASHQASTLRSAAKTIQDPAKRAQYLKDAYNKEIEAHGNSKKARMLGSGAFQGGVGGGGIGMAVGAGLGTVVGTVVGTVATIPTTAVGTLVGAGVGGVHGPWIKLGKSGGKEEEEEEEEEETDAEGREGGERAGNGKDEGDVVPDPAALREAARVVGEAEADARMREDGQQQQQKKTKTKKKKPRKLEVRSAVREPVR